MSRSWILCVHLGLALGASLGCAGGDAPPGVAPGSGGATSPPAMGGAGGSGASTSGAGGTPGAGGMAVGVPMGGATPVVDAGSGSGPDSGSDVGRSDGAEADGHRDAARIGPVLVYSRTTLVRHESIPRAVMTVRQALRDRGFTVEASEDPSWFTSARLAPLAAVILLSTTGTALGAPGGPPQAALEAYVRAGGVLVGLHSASSTTYAPEEPLTRLIGGKFVEHPGGVRRAACHAVGNHPAVAALPAPFVTEDEIYEMSHLDPGNQVVLTCDAFGRQEQLPIAWHRRAGQGLVFYTALGHKDADWGAESPYFKLHAWPAILWALGL